MNTRVYEGRWTFNPLIHVRHYSDAELDAAARMHDEQLEYAREQAQLWKHLGLEDCAEQIDAHLENEFGLVSPGVVGDALVLEGVR